MMWWIYLFLAGILYSVFQREIVRKLKVVKKWYEKNKDKVEEWAKNREIKKAWEELSEAIRKAQLDKKWTVFEILEVIMLAKRLFDLLENYERGKLGR